jgi:hypothetical protein
VITIELDRRTGKYSLIMNKNSNEDRAIIFTSTIFTGLTNEDKMKLKNYGINYVKIFRIGPRDFFDIVPEWTPIEHIEDYSPVKAMAFEPREIEFTGPVPRYSYNGGDGKISTILLVILPIILLILITLVVVIVFFFVKREGTMKKYSRRTEEEE